MISAAIRPDSFPWFDYSRYSFLLGLSLGPDRATLSGHSASAYYSDRAPGDLRKTIEYVTPEGLAGYRGWPESAGTGWWSRGRPRPARNAIRFSGRSSSSRSTRRLWRSRDRR